MERQHDIFSARDENRLIDFFKRAHVALLAARILPPSLSILDNPDAGWLAEQADLVALAKEYNGPFHEAGDEVFFGNVRTALNVFLTGTPEGKYYFNFRTVASDETSYWTRLPDGMKAFGLYFVREGGNGWGTFLVNAFIYENAPDDAKDQYGRTAADLFAEENENDNGDFGRQFGYNEFPFAASLDTRDDVSAPVRFDVDLVDLDLSKVNIPDGRLDLATRLLDAVQDAAEERADEDAQEYFTGNAVHPKVLLAA